MEWQRSYMQRFENFSFFCRFYPPHLIGLYLVFFFLFFLLATTSSNMLTHTYNLTSWLFTYNFKIMFAYGFLLF